MTKLHLKRHWRPKRLSSFRCFPSAVVGMHRCENTHLCSCVNKETMSSRGVENAKEVTRDRGTSDAGRHQWLAGAFSIYREQGSQVSIVPEKVICLLCMRGRAAPRGIRTSWWAITGLIIRHGWSAIIWFEIRQSPGHQNVVLVAVEIKIKLTNYPICLVAVKVSMYFGSAGG